MNLDTPFCKGDDKITFHISSFMERWDGGEKSMTCRND
jgi:hypothetical protein